MISFIVPAFNEEKNIAATVLSIYSAARRAGVADDDLDIVIVNDGSTDHTGAVVSCLMERHSNIQMVTHEVNRGYGPGFRNGLAAVKAERFIVVPGDNDMSVDMLEMMLRHRTEADIIMAFPINIENRTLARNVVSICYRMFYMLAFRIYVNYVNSPCVYPTRKVRELLLYSQGFSIIAETTTKLLLTGCRYAEIPGYFQAQLRVRRTVTLKNLLEVARSFARLVLEAHILKRHLYGGRPQRVQIDLTRASTNVTANVIPFVDKEFTPEYLLAQKF